MSGWVLPWRTCIDVQSLNVFENETQQDFEHKESSQAWLEELYPDCESHLRVKTLGFVICEVWILLLSCAMWIVSHRRFGLDGEEF